MSQSGRVALVTGGTRRVGRAIVERLIREGFTVATTWRSSQTEAQSLRESHGDAIHLIHADLADPAAAVTQIGDGMGAVSSRLDLLVNNASLYEPSALAQTDLAQMRRMMAVHYEAPLLLAQALGPRLRASRGHIVNMVDLLAEHPWPQYLAYCASKAALLNLTLGLARELAPEVTVNGIAPGVVEWPADYPESDRDKYLSRVPLARAGTPEDVANLVHFLATEGGYITGQVIRLDGGRSLT